MERRKGQTQVSREVACPKDDANFRRSGIYLIPILILSSCDAILAEDVYKWTDEAGRVYYADFPGDDEPEILTISPDPPLDENLERRQERRRQLLDELDNERQVRLDEEQKQQQAREERRLNCNRARRRLVAINASSYLFQETDDPYNPRILSQTEREIITRNARRAVTRLCEITVQP